MAWSDAARAAALAARRARMKGKEPHSVGGGTVVSRDQVARVTKSLRSQLKMSSRMYPDLEVRNRAIKALANKSLQTSVRLGFLKGHSSVRPTFNQKPTGGYPKSDKSYWARMSRLKK